MRNESGWKRRAVSPVQVGLALAGFVALVCVGIYVFGGDDGAAKHAEKKDTAIPEKRSIRVGDDEIEFLFAKSARSGDVEVDRFISNFLDILVDTNMERAYKNYRLNVTELRRPIGRESFQKASYKAKKIEVKAVVKVTEPSQILVPELKKVEPPVYCIEAHIELRGKDAPARDIKLFVFKEKGRWVSSH